ncbi:hypothetical protein [Erythrobacter sp. WG]|uniref:hypothetical protein n=1 Tax=Erythrobacter sp. WG TaxID=2985510 RepID=UPI00226E2BE4|nr:hypothetical protein [Erythrobacter sp. WG]MCX9146613.1 hypothetical protein [Erythrobacter sp. WG]
MSITQSGFNRTVANAVVPGGPIGNIAVPGIRHGDTLLSVVSVTSANPPVPTDRMANASIPAGSEGRIAMAAVNTTGLHLVVTWAKAQ